MFSPEYIKDTFDKFSSLTITVAGDVMADVYLEGRVERISPEAPVPVVEIRKKRMCPGGAGNVALNLIALGTKVNLTSIVGNDDTGNQLVDVLAGSRVNMDFVTRSSRRITTAKTRILGNHAQMLRIDEEQTDFLENNEEQIALEYLRQSLQDSNALIFQDYDKGFLTPNIIEEGIRFCSKKNIPVAVDPKVRGFFFYKGATLFKPNFKELKTGLQLNISPTDRPSLNSAAKQLRQELAHRYTLITLSEHGIYGEENGHEFAYPAHLRKIADVSGAGDTVIAVATACLASGADYTFAAALANLAGGMVCESPGVVAIDKENLYTEALRLLVHK